MAKYDNIKRGDWVLHKTEHGKVWKLCEVLEKSNARYNNNEPILGLKNIHAKTCEWGFTTYGDPVIIPVPKNTDFKSMNISTIVTLFCKNDTNPDEFKFFEKSKSYNIQINTKNKDLMNKIITTINNDDSIPATLEEMDHLNVNIAAKYELKEKPNG